MGKGHPGGKLKGSSHVMHNKDKWHIAGIDAEICSRIRK